MEGVVFIKNEVKQEQTFPKILVLTHGFFGSELIKSAELVIGKMENTEFIPLTSDISALFSKQKKIPAIAGLNLSIFISCSTNRQEKRGEELVQAVLKEAGNSIQQIKL